MNDDNDLRTRRGRTPTPKPSLKGGERDLLSRLAKLVAAGRVRDAHACKQRKPSASPLSIIVALSTCTLAPAAAAQALGFHDLVTIDDAVARFTGAGIGRPGGANLPVDRRMRLAPCRSELTLSWYGARQDNVLVQCPDTGGWRLFVAVSGNVRQGAAPAEPPAVARGEAVTIAIAGEGFSVSQTGEAMEAGAIGAWIRVRTSAKATSMRAQITRPGLVVVPIE